MSGGEGHPHERVDHHFKLLQHRRVHCREDHAAVAGKTSHRDAKDVREPRRFSARQSTRTGRGVSERPVLYGGSYGLGATRTWTGAGADERALWGLELAELVLGRPAGGWRPLACLGWRVFGCRRLVPLWLRQDFLQRNRQLFRFALFVSRNCKFLRNFCKICSPYVPTSVPYRVT